MALRKNDPYNEMDSGHEGIRPGFLGGSGDTEEGVHGLFRKDEGTGRSRAEKRAARIEAKAAEKDAASSAAAEDLEGAEEGASSGGFWRGGDNLDETQDAEEEANGFYSGSGKDADKKKLKAKKSKLSFLKRGGPSFGILGSIVAIGGLMGGMQSLMPFAIEEMIIEKFNSIGISSTISSDAWLNTQLNYGVRIGNTITNEPENLFAFSHFQVQQFEGQGIKVVEGIGTENTSITALLYLKNNEYIPVVGSDFIQYESLVPAIKTASGLDNIGTPVQAKDALTDPAFKVPYTTASKAWRGGGSGWFDNIMSNVTEAKLSLTRRRWTGWVTGGVESATARLLKFRDTAGKSSAISNTTDTGMDSLGQTQQFGDNGQPLNQNDGQPVLGEDQEISRVRIDEDGSSTYENTSQTSLSTNDTLSQVSDILNSKAVKAASGIATYGCALLEAYISVYSVISAYQHMQFLNLISGFLEAVDKVKAGYGVESPIDEYAKNMTLVGETTNKNGEVVARKTAMQSAGMAWLFGGSAVGRNDVSVQNVNFESIMSDIDFLSDNFTTLSGFYESCGYARAGVAVINLATTVLSFIPIFGSGIKALQLGVKQLANISIKVATQLAIAAFIPYAAKSYLQLAIKNVAIDWLGEDLGNAVVSAAGIYLGGNATSGGLGPGSEAKVGAYIQEQNDVIAEEANYQRAIRNPFDVTSRHTFLGSLAYSFIPFAYSGNSLMHAVSNLSSLTESSLVGLSPSISAASQLSTGVGDCQLLETTGAVGDAFCNPYIITDTSTIKSDPVVLNEQITSNSLFDDNFENNKIKEGSNLAKYIAYCGQRTSQYGIFDLSIASSIKNNDSFGFLNYVPLISDIIQFGDGINESNNASWINGSVCVASERNDNWDTEYKYYQRYAENQRLLENMNPGYKSEVTAFLEDYYEKNPLDQSFEGTLARFSGMTKDQVEDTLALMEYYRFLDEYDPSERLAFVEPKETKEIKFDNDYKLAQVFYILTNQISYNDIRNRTFAV